MRAKNFTPEEITRLLTNRNNPQTMDYYFAKFFKLSTEETTNHFPGMVSLNGQFVMRVTSSNMRNSAAFELVRGTSNSRSLSSMKNRQCTGFFVIELPRTDAVPMTRRLKQVSFRTINVNVVNPDAGQRKTINHSRGYTIMRTEPETKPESKKMILYGRNAWDKKEKQIKV
jgi:hypothetical protein